MASSQFTNISTQAEQDTEEQVCVGVEAQSESSSAHILNQAINNAGTSKLQEDCADEINNAGTAKLQEDCAEKDVPVELHNILEVKEDHVMEDPVPAQSPDPEHSAGAGK